MSINNWQPVYPSTLIDVEKEVATMCGEIKFGRVPVAYFFEGLRRLKEEIGKNYSFSCIQKEEIFSN